MTRDPQLSERFHEEAAGLSIQALGDEPDAYRMLVSGGQPVGGLAGPVPDQAGWPSRGPEGHWISYLGTDDVDAAADRGARARRRRAAAPTDVPGMGPAAVLRDPDGAPSDYSARRRVTLVARVADD